MPNDLFTQWLKEVSTPYDNVTLYGERKGARPIGLKALKPVLADYFVGEANILRAGGYEKAAALITNSLPTNKQTRSGICASCSRQSTSIPKHRSWCP